MQRPIDQHAALIFTMMLVSAAEGVMTDAELDMIGRQVRYLPVFREFDHQRLTEVGRDCADLLRGYGAVAEQEQGWNSANIELGWGFWILVDVELHYAKLVFIVGGDRIEQRRDHLARTAPFGPEVEQHGLLRLHYVLFESRVCRMYDLTTHNAESSRFLGRPETPWGGWAKSR